VNAIVPALSFESFEVTTTGLTIHGEVDFEVWLKYGAALRTVEMATPWVKGDYLNQGEARYGDKYLQATALWPDNALQTLANCKYVARAIPPERRNENLSWSAHAELASLEPKEQEKWIEAVEENEWTVSELREELRPTVIVNTEEVLDYVYRAVGAKEMLKELLNMFGMKAVVGAIREIAK
jgi:hypothetical protein